MFCNQCEETARNVACTTGGVCGKSPDLAAAQDLLTYALQGLSVVAERARQSGITDDVVNTFTVEGLFATVTNVNFDVDDIAVMIHRAVALRDDLKARLDMSGYLLKGAHDAVTFRPGGTVADIVAQGAAVTLENRLGEDPDVNSLKLTVLFGIRGMAAYADHALKLGQQDDAVYAYIHETLAAMLRTDEGLMDWVERAMSCGTMNLRTMELLDAANTGAYGHPVPTKVPLGAKRGKAIVVSGHDLKDLSALLTQTAGTGISIYTHGEMLPTHGYPELKKHPHFYGHYGTAWQNQQKEFAAFPGAILMTTNCIRRPAPAYQDNIFTSGVVGWPGVRHINGDDFSPVIERALDLPGFNEDTDAGEVTVGFGHNTVLGIASTVIDAVKRGDIRRFFLVGGCDGARPGRNYYTEFVERVPDDCVVLTLACGKFRFFDKDLGTIGGIPRLLDIGQCNDAYSAIRIAQALADAFGVGVNELPLSFVLSWYEQKAVVILLTLLSLGVKHIRLGPSLPAFLTPNVLNFLVENYDIRAITTPEEDLAAIMGTESAATA